MNEILIVFASATTATRVKKTLANMGYKTSVVQTPKILSISGCSYSIKGPAPCLSEVFVIAQRMEVRIKGVFELSGNSYIPIPF